MGRLSLRGLMGCLAAADVVISCDTGPLHLAVGLGSPVLALFGAADIRRTGPYFYRDYTLQGEADCAPCRKRYCKQEENTCLTSITPEQVMAQLKRLFQDYPPAG